VYDEGAAGGVNDDTWDKVAVTAALAVGSCPTTSGYTANATEAAAAQTVTFGTALNANVVVGSLIRFFRRAKYKLYPPAGSSWWSPSRCAIVPDEDIRYALTFTRPAASRLRTCDVAPRHRRHWRDGRGRLSRRRSILPHRTQLARRATRHGGDGARSRFGVRDVEQVVEYAADGHRDHACLQRWRWVVGRHGAHDEAESTLAPHRVRGARRRFRDAHPRAPPRRHAR